MIAFGQLFSLKIGGLVNNALQKCFARLSCSVRNSCVYIQDDNRRKENIEDQDNIEKISSEEIVNLQKLEETPQKKKRTTKRSSVLEDAVSKLETFVWILSHV